MRPRESEPGPWQRASLLLGGCLLLGFGVALLLTPQLGSDGFSTLVSGVSLGFEVQFVVANALVSLLFLSAAWLRGVRPGLGTLAQVTIVGGTVSVVLPLLQQPDSMLGRYVMLASAMPVAAIGIALYLGSRTGAGPAEAAAQAWDPPVPFAWSYSVVQGTGALVGWQLGGAIGPGTVAATLLLGPLTSFIGQSLRLDVRAA